VGATLPTGGLQGGRQTLSESGPRYATIVPDISGIDKEFAYLVPPTMGDVAPGDRVRIVLNGRRVAGWVVAVSDHAPSGIDPSRIVALSAHSGRSVSPDVVDLTSWIASHWFGGRRAVLVSASAPRVGIAVVHPRRGRFAPTGSDDADARTSIAEAMTSAARDGGGMLRVPPLVSVLPGVLALAADAPVLVVCPTLRMAALGAAWLRRRGAQVAVMPDDWDAARAGVDVVIGARSSVLAPCTQMGAIVVIDAHDESLKEERNPAWDALSVALERGHRSAIPVIATSPVPPAVTGVARPVGALPSWPRIVIEDLSLLPAAGSLLGSGLLEAVRRPGAGTLCVLNTKGGARLISCRSCRSVQRCGKCRSALVLADGDLSCPRCAEQHGAVCVVCGGVALRILKSGTGGLLADIAKSTGIRGVEVTAESVADSLVGGVFVGTESILNRVGHADTVVFCDIDRDLGVPRVTAVREVLAMVAKAARIVGAAGTVVVQTHDPDHPVMRALAAADVDAAVADLLAADLESRRTLGLPPFARVLRITGATGVEVGCVQVPDGADVAHVAGVIEVRAPDDETARLIADEVARRSATAVSVRADPSRF